MDLFGLHAVVFWDFVTCVIPEVVALPIHVHVDRKIISTWQCSCLPFSVHLLSFRHDSGIANHFLDDQCKE